MHARAELAALRVEPHLEPQLFRYLELLRHWNKTINLTALPLDPLTDEAIDRLIIEPLAIADSIPTEPSTWIDVGSGGGSPAIPIKIARPSLQLVMVESKERKAAFLREAIRELALPDAAVENVRFETLKRPETLGVADLLTVRAVRLDPDFLAVCAHVLRDRGLLIPIGFSGQLPAGFTAGPHGAFCRVPRGTIA